MRLLIEQPPGGTAAYWQLLKADFTKQFYKPTERPDVIQLFIHAQKVLRYKLRL